MARKITFIYENELGRKHFVSNRDILVAELQRLESTGGSHLIIKTEPHIENVTFIQVAHNTFTKKGLFKTKTRDSYQIELQTSSEKGCNQYRFETEDFSIIQRIFTDYYDSHKIPDYSSWEDITKENPNWAELNKQSVIIAEHKRKTTIPSLLSDSTGTPSYV